MILIELLVGDKLTSVPHYSHLTATPYHDAASYSWGIFSLYKPQFSNPAIVWVKIKNGALYNKALVFSVSFLDL